MAIAFVAENDGAGGNTITDPSTAAGQFLIVGYGDDGNASNPISSIPSGWTQQAYAFPGGDGQNTAVLYNPSSGGVGGTAAFGNVLDNPCEICCAYTGVSSTPFDVTITNTTAATGGVNATWTVTAPSITTVTDGCVILLMVMPDLSNTANLTSATCPGFTLRDLVNRNSAAVSSVAILEANQTTHGATGTNTITLGWSAGNATGGWSVFTVALRPAVLGNSATAYWFRA